MALTISAENQAVEAFCCRLQYFVRNSIFLLMDPSAIAISSSMYPTETLTPRFGLAFLISFKSFHFSTSSIMYKKGASRFSLLVPLMTAVPRRISSSYMPSA